MVRCVVFWFFEERLNKKRQRIFAAALRIAEAHGDSIRGGAPLAVRRGLGNLYGMVPQRVFPPFLRAEKWGRSRRSEILVLRPYSPKWFASAQARMLSDFGETSSPKRKRSAGLRFGFRLRAGRRPYSAECQVPVQGHVPE